MSQEPVQHPRFLLSIDRIGQSEEWNSRYRNGVWQPPRPLGSNIRLPAPTTGTVYEYYRGRVRIVTPPRSGWQPFQTYSFYCSEGKIYAYPADAVHNMVADGSGNSRRGAVDEPGEDTSDDDQDSDDDNDNGSFYDWRSLSFSYPLNGDNSFTSYICFRGHQQYLWVLRQDQQHLRAISELLPNAYLSGSQRVAHDESSESAPCGGLVGNIAVLIALVAFSVAPEQVEVALTRCFRHCYISHGGQRGIGWTNGRGLMVRVLREVDSSAASPERTLQDFELGRLPQYGKFIA